jgi:hypothetical protein
MRVRFLLLAAIPVALILQSILVADPPEKKTPKEALQLCHDLIGTWRSTATPNGTKEEQTKNFWVETVTWEWQFKDKDAWFTVSFDKSKHFSKGTLKYVPDKENYVLTLTNLNKEDRTFTGTLNDKVLTLDSEADANGEVYRVVLNMLHDNRHLYHLAKKKADKASFTKVYWAGATREGVEFASGSDKPECVVSGGLGTQKVSYMGKDYYVCCSGCAAEFKADPAKYVKDFEEKKAKKGKK